jgi:hypothetical protein
VSNIVPVDLELMEQVFSVQERQGTAYGYGVKADQGEDANGKPYTLERDSHTIKEIDCSGESRYLLAKATDQQLIIPDGSQAQREWFEAKAAAGEVHQIAHYADIPRYMTPRRLIICFIKPFTNGCGDIGHVFFLRQYDDATWSMESHGGAGCTRRPWNYPTLKREFYNGFELPTK